MKHETPTEEIFNEMKEAAIKIWTQNYSDEFGYVSEKLGRINSIRNYADNAMVFYRMFDMLNQLKIRAYLSVASLNYIKENL